MLTKIHSNLCDKSLLYKKWHEHPSHSFYHFLVVISLSILVATGTMLESSKLSAYNDSNLLTTNQASPGLKTNKSIQTLNSELLQAIGIFQASVEPNKKTALENLISIAKERKQKIKAEFDKKNFSFENQFLPSEIYGALPTEVLEYLEKDTEVTGTLNVLHIDYFDESKSEFLYELTTDAESGKPEKKYKIKPKENLNLLTGSKVRVKGKQIDSELYVAAAEGGSVNTLNAAAATTLGNQNTLIILINFTDQITQPFSTTTVANNIFHYNSSSNAYYQQNSYNQTSFSGNVVGWFTIPYSYTNCSTSYNAWAAAADQAATAAGVNVAAYARIGYIFPSNGTCGWSGLGTLGGNPSRMWSNGSSGTSLVSHEFGHNLGVHHAQSLNCGSSQIGTYPPANSPTCSINEYGDNSSAMGSSSIGHFNSAHKSAVSWLASSQIIQVSQNGTYNLTPISSVGGIKAIKIQKPDTNEWYYLTYRQPIGFDANIASGYLSGVSIHIWNEYISSQTKLVDTKPGSTGGVADSPLSDGQTFTDSVNGVNITQISHSPTEATFQVNFTPPVCSLSIPTVYISPSTQTGSSGQTLTYTATVSNTNSSACPVTDFNLTLSGLPLGFTYNFSKPILSIGSKTSTSTQLYITSLATSPNSNNIFTVRATNASSSTYTASTQATYVVFNDTIAPVVNITNPINGSKLSGSSVTIQASATDNIAVSKVEFYIDNVLIATDTASPYTYKWNTRKVTSGSHTISVKAYDGAGNSAIASITVTK